MFSSELSQLGLSKYEHFLPTRERRSLTSSNIQAKCLALHTFITEPSSWTNEYLVAANAALRTPAIFIIDKERVLRLLLPDQEALELGS